MLTTERNIVGDESFTAAVPMWNNLLVYLRHDIDLGQFGQRRKTLLFGIS